jgi:hypothetical protein
MAQSTVSVPTSTIDKLAALGRAMLSLAEEMKRHPHTVTPDNIPIPDLTPPAVIPEGEEWFWSEEWLAGEREVNEHLRRGEYMKFNSVEELLADLHRHV